MLLFRVEEDDGEEAGVMIMLMKEAEDTKCCEKRLLISELVLLDHLCLTDGICLFLLLLRSSSTACTAAAAVSCRSDLPD